MSALSELTAKVAEFSAEAAEENPPLRSSASSFAPSAVMDHFLSLIRSIGSIKSSVKVVGRYLERV